MKSKMNQLIENQKNVHVLYSYYEMEDYLEMVVSFILDGIEAGEYTILIENDRLYPLIQEELSTRLTEVQMKFIHFVNSLSFYYSSGSYHPLAIAAYFNKMIHPYVVNKISFRSWAHVEWSSIEEPLHLISDFEKIVDQAVNEVEFPLICAYSGIRMPSYLKTILLETHPYVLLEDDFIVSDLYQPSKVEK
ncbi:MEDS domain-containing protein [Psychrobacillus antarcticus]|uniref:MEDS domain-containing protein n=1 Tax=Psychrobacillus antarcticus TaxID=2879115 RepID=UPI002408651E|nr:MEDS domain-containing protein [Psychrobacillus antarcticus]